MEEMKGLSTLVEVSELASQFGRFLEELGILLRVVRWVSIVVCDGSERLELEEVDHTSDDLVSDILRTC